MLCTLGDTSLDRSNVNYENERTLFHTLPLKRRCEPSNPKFSEVALDSGVRTFQTFYSPEGICGKLGDGTSNGLKRIFVKEDRIKSVIANEGRKIGPSTARGMLALSHFAFKEKLLHMI